MGWTPEQLLRHKKVNSLLGVNVKPPDQATEIAKVTEKTWAYPNMISFVVVGPPMGKPRMTQRDVWKQRPVVLRYRDYCDRIMEAAPNRVLNVDVYAVDVCAYLAMPKSWNQKKKAAHKGQMHRAKPDWDNIAKAVCDALFKDDSGVADGRCRKFWCSDEEQRTEITVSFHEKSVLK